MISVFYRRFWAYFYACLLTTGSLVGVLHTTIAHPDCHEADICIIEVGHSETHVHDARYAADNCDLCDFLRTHSDVPPMWSWLLPKQVMAKNKVIISIKRLFTGQIYDWYPLRGPPARFDCII